jgi:hypothetical protein
LDIDKTVEVRIREIVAFLLRSNEFLHAVYFASVLDIVCMVKMSVQVSGADNIGGKQSS